MMPNAICPASLDCFGMTDCEPNRGTNSCENYWTCKSWTWAWSLPYTYDLEKKVLTVSRFGDRYSSETNRIYEVGFRELIRDAHKKSGWYPAVTNPYYPIENDPIENDLIPF